MYAAKDDARPAKTVDTVEARLELDRLLADPRFYATERARRLLKYIAERYFDGETQGAKARSIAVDVLGRSPHFDPRSDPIVRIEMSRLRSALGAYYEAYGGEVATIIQVPTGRYVTLFTRSRTASEPLRRAGAKAVAARLVELWRSPSTRYGRAAGATIVAAIVAAGLTGAAVIIGAGGAAMTRPPALILDMSAASGANRDEADLLQHYLVSALSRFSTLTVAQRGDLPRRGLDNRGPPVRRQVYRVRLKYASSSGGRSVWWEAIDVERGVVFASGLERARLDGRDMAAVRGEIVAALATTLGATRGAISAAAVGDGEGEQALGNTCVLHAEYALDEGNRAGIAKARACLERTLRAAPGNADALATLSRICASFPAESRAEAQSDCANALAQEAVARAPLSDRAHIALMMARFQAGDSAAAIAAGRRGLELNANNPDVRAKLATVLYSAGEHEAAVELARRAAQGASAPPDALLVLALDCYSRGDYSRASMLAEQMPLTNVLAMALRVAAQGAMGSPAAKTTHTALTDFMPDYRLALCGWMQRRGYDPALIEALQRQLHAVDMQT
jgi:tetratricopeptide (TPR) repeat protein